jgi:hypothetical protein
MYQTARRRWELDWGNQRFQVNEWVEYCLVN